MERKSRKKKKIFHSFIKKHGKDTHGLEDGYAIDLLSVGIVLLFATLIIFVMLGYTKTLEKKLNADIIGKNYLYRMENDGYLSSEVKDEMIEEYAKQGMTCTVDSRTTSRQVAYGNPVVLVIDLSFDNPSYEVMTMNGIANIIAPNKIDYHLEYSTTSKW